MKRQVRCELSYAAGANVTSILSILAAKSDRQTVLSESLTVTPTVSATELAAPDLHRLLRLEIPEPTHFTITYQATVESNYQEINAAVASPVPVAQLPAGIIPYLYPSRYCQSDQLYRFAQHHFGHLETDYNIVTAITDWIYANVEYVSGSSNTQTAALDTITQQAGVCRDFAHLAIALCRALSIPARYFTCYAYKLNPPDFHACFEAYLGGHWLLFDATRLAPLNGLVKIATGRDAADVAVATHFGTISLSAMQVGCDIVAEDFVPFYNEAASGKGLVY